MIRVHRHQSDLRELRRRRTSKLLKKHSPQIADDATAMMVVLDIILSLIAWRLGLSLGVEYWGRRMAAYWLSRTLADDQALSECWSDTYGKMGGVVSVLRQERSGGWEPVPPLFYAMVIDQEVRQHDCVARSGLVIIAVTVLMAAIVSAFTSWWVVASLAGALAMSLLARDHIKKKIGDFVVRSVVDLFRSVRLWMEVDRDTLDSQKSQLGVNGIVRVIDAMEPVHESGALLHTSEARLDCPLARIVGMAGYNFGSKSNVDISSDLMRFESVRRRNGSCSAVKSPVDRARSVYDPAVWRPAAPLEPPLISPMARPYDAPLASRR